MIEIYLAAESDMSAVLNIDKPFVEEKSRKSLIIGSIQKSECIICVVDGTLAGYAIFNKGFFQQTFIWLLFTSSHFRRIGVGSSLIRYIESKCETPKLFISTNQSNKNMQNLMDKLGFSKTGYLENLDEGDPEIFYFKRIDRNQ